jgi:hypothetical protein
VAGIEALGLAALAALLIRSGIQTVRALTRRHPFRRTLLSLGLSAFIGGLFLALALAVALFL